MVEELKLKAFDEDGLTIISSLCQDSIIKENEYDYDEKSKRFAILMNRFCHEAIDKQRIRTAIHFDYVENLKTKNINKDDKDETLVLLAIKFDEIKKCVKMVRNFWTLHILWSIKPDTTICSINKNILGV